MKILLGFNGSDAATAALADLGLAGLPDNYEVLVITVAEAWHYPRNVAEARDLAEKAKHDLITRHPGNKVDIYVTEGSPANEILALAETYEPDLIVVGEPQSPSPGTHMFLGATSQKILTRSPYSVRVARASMRTSPGFERLLVGFDGSPGALNAVRSIASRSWPANTEVCLLSVADTSVLDTIGRFTPQIETRLATQWAETLAASSLSELAEVGLTARVEVRPGNAKFEVTRYAAEWGADTIFVGPHCSANSFERFLIGSVSMSVAAAARCSVEIVR